MRPRRVSAVTALLSVLEPQAVDCPRARLVHDPAEHRPVRGVVARRAPPDVMEDIDGELFGGLPVRRPAAAAVDSLAQLVHQTPPVMITRGAADRLLSAL